MKLINKLKDYYRAYKLKRLLEKRDIEAFENYFQDYLINIGDN